MTTCSFSPSSSAQGARPTRRAFLTTLTNSSLAVAGGWWSRSALAQTLATGRGNVVAVPMRARQTVSSFAPPLVNPDTLRTLARAALEAATRAGARSADIRLGDRREFQCYGSEGGFMGGLQFTYSYGLRVEVDGVIAWIGGTDPTPERIVLAAQSAVATARGLAKINTTMRRAPSEYAPLPVVTGEWRAPLQIDPFAVSPDEHTYALAGFPRLNQTFRGPVAVGEINVTWTAETRVFASSEGSMVTQYLAGMRPDIKISGFSNDPAFSGIERLMPHTIAVLPLATAGFEAVLGIAIRERVEQAMHDLVPWTQYRLGQGDVGRKELILDGPVSAAVIGQTVIPALALDRVLGEEQDVSGTSFLAPPQEILGQPLFAPVLNVSVVTGGTHFGRVQWDDDGVAPQTHRVIEHGAVVNYFTARTNVQTLRDWYTQRGQPVQPLGVARTLDVGDVPRPIPGACAVESVPNGPSLMELAASMEDGVIVRDGYINVDQQGAGGSIIDPIMFEVKKGVITRRLLNMRVEFSTKQLLKDILAVGGAGTESTITNGLIGGVPVKGIEQTVTAPALQIRDGNLMSTALRSA